MPKSIETVEHEDPMQVAKTILQQLGGQRFIRFTGARKFVGGENFLILHLPKYEREISMVQITLTPRDTYEMKFWKKADVRRPESLVPVKVIEEVYCDQLQDMFTEVTGIVTKL
jgi:hypothetical protein